MQDKKGIIVQTIQILPDALINKIAAGEVIENPTSVIKELVENSIDANAKNIRLEIKGSGLQSIKVEDDGCGMNKEDAVFCFERHATSKIQKFEDLINVSSMGFRGEALASIAAVSKVELKTSENTVATCVKIEGTKIISINEIARTKGTTIEVKSLFYNVPVRKKFQKSLSYINSEIIKTCINLSLSKPNIGFSLILNDKKVFSTHFNDEKKEISFKKRIKELLSNEFSSTSIEVNFEANNIKIFGFIGDPSSSKKTRAQQYLIINDRLVTSHIISRFIKDAYSTRIAEDDFPIYALHIEVPQNFIDVNVHPQKKEIRISEQIYIKEAIKKAIDNAFLDKDFVIENKVEEKKEIFFDKEISFKKIEDENFQNKPKENIFDKFEKQLIFEKLDLTETIFKDFFQINNFVFIDAKLFKSYLDLKDEDEIILIDLSAIYSYLLTEKITSKKNISKSQNLLIPIIIELDKYDINFIEENHQNLSNLGFEIRVISKNSIAIDSMPDILTKDNLKNLFFLIIEDLHNFDKTNLVDKIYEKKIAKEISLLSKKKNFSKKEAIDLLKMLIDMKNVKFDFLGNPFFITFNKEKIEKFFKK